MIAAEVKLWGTRIGVVSVDDQSPFCFFRYDPAFLASGISPSPVKMPLTNEVYQFKTLPLTTFKGLPGLLADILPDRYGNALIDAWLAAEGRPPESLNIIERLCYVGTRGMGALEIYPQTDRFLNKTETIQIEHLVQLSNEILNLKKEQIVHTTDNIKDLIKVGTSAGGARAKAIIAYNEQTGEIKSGQINAGKGFTYWLLKLDGIDQETSMYTRIEYAYYLMAKEAKIDMTESRLLINNGRYHFMTKRFDRKELTNGTIEKVHMQTLGSLIHVDYNEPGIVSYEEVVRIMNQLGCKRVDYEQFFRRMVFNVMSRNQDDHVKNISFLMDKKGQWSLSPAYDMTYAYNPTGKWTSMHQMSIGGKRSNIQLTDIMKSAEAMRITQTQAVIMVNEVKQSLMRWSEFAQRASIDHHVISKIYQEFNFI